MLKVYTDAAVNGNPGSAGIGIVISGNGIYEQLAIPLSGKWDNHSAEWEAMRIAIKWVETNQTLDSLILLYTDSQVVARSISKKYVKNINFKPFLTDCLSSLNHFPFYEIHWIPEKQNKGADNLAKQGLQKAINS
ncbi:hypothetical protein BKP56_09445 [Marinilactibacillus sp. 15R]|uniref:ribonuclease HI family protein n=1 Tax=Marinilactibacillus sp. 15R TaxID=1911586 RepID=UPI00090C7E66|nr:ribonuclease HI family protein [Marinilactibacillus sp. 15R]API89463.1 hypothetical protein BKP56_09445 [Marinilactibacillus sp. 15R]